MLLHSRHQLRHQNEALHTSKRGKLHVPGPALVEGSGGDGSELPREGGRHTGASGSYNITAALEPDWPYLGTNDTNGTGEITNIRSLQRGSRLAIPRNK